LGTSEISVLEKQCGLVFPQSGRIIEAFTAMRFLDSARVCYIAKDRLICETVRGMRTRSLLTNFVAALFSNACLSRRRKMLSDDPCRRNKRVPRRTAIVHQPVKGSSVGNFSGSVDVRYDIQSNIYFGRSFAVHRAS
jgi:hypothetical protein